MVKKQGLDLSGPCLVINFYRTRRCLPGLEKPRRAIKN